MFVQDSVFKGSLIWPESFSPSSGSWKMPLSPLWAWESAGWFCTCFVASLCVPANGNIKSYQHCGEFQFDFCVLVWSPAVLGLLGFWGRGELKEIKGQGRALLGFVGTWLWAPCSQKAHLCRERCLSSQAWPQQCLKFYSLHIWSSWPSGIPSGDANLPALSSC